MAGTNAFTNENHEFYNSTMQTISIGGRDCTTKVGDLCAYFVDMGYLVKTQVEIGLSKIFNLRGQTIDMSDQVDFTLNYSVLHDEEGNKINISDLLTATQRRPGNLFLSMMTVHPDQSDTN